MKTVTTKDIELVDLNDRMERLLHYAAPSVVGAPQVRRTLFGSRHS